MAVFWRRKRRQVLATDRFSGVGAGAGLEPYPASPKCAQPSIPLSPLPESIPFPSASNPAHLSRPSQTPAVVRSCLGPCPARSESPSALFPGTCHTLCWFIDLCSHGLGLCPVDPVRAKGGSVVCIFLGYQSSAQALPRKGSWKETWKEWKAEIL